MAFAITLIARGFEQAKRGLVSLKDGVLGIAAAEKRLATDTDQATRAQHRLAEAARRAREQFEKQAQAARATGGGSGVGRVTGSGGLAGRVFALNALGQSNSDLRSSIAGRAHQERLGGLQSDSARRGGRLAMLGQLADANRDAHSTARDRIAAGGGGRGGGAGGNIFARIGGALGGGTLSKVGGAIGMPTAGLAALGLGAIAAGIALGEFGKAVERGKQEITRIGELRNDVRDAIRTAFQGANDAAIGAAKGNRSAIAALVGAGKLEQGQKLGAEFGEGGLRAVGGLQQKGLLNESVVQAMRLAVGTGQMSAEQFSTTIGGKRGLAAAGDPEAIARAVMANAGIHGVDLKGAGAAFGGSAQGRAFSALDSAEAFRQDKALARFAGGGTEGGIREEAARIASPATAAILEIKRGQDDAQKILDDIAASQGKMAALWDAIVNRGDSATNTAQRTARQTSAALNPSE
jgi:hypothetical protein